MMYDRQNGIRLPIYSSSILHDTEPGSRSIFLWLGVVLMLLGCLLSINRVDVQTLFWLFVYAYATLGLSALLKKFAGKAYGLLFLSSILVRLVVVLSIELFPPDSPSSAWRYVPGVVFEDETYYVEAGRSFGDSVETIFQINFASPYERVAGYFAGAFLAGGQETLWGRLLNTLVGGLAAVVLYDMMLRSSGDKIQKWVWWFCVLSPTLVIWSSFYLKEILIALGVGLFVNATVRLYRGQFSILALLMLVGGGFVCGWARGAVLAPLLPALLIAVVFRIDRKVVSFLFVPGVFLSVLLVLMMLFAPLQIGEWGAAVFSEQTPGMFYQSAGATPEQYAIKFPFYSDILGLAGPARVLGMSFLLTISPVITSLWSLMPLVGEPNWMAFAVSGYSVSWWVCLPLICRAFYDALRQRDTWWVAWGGGFLLWFMISAYVRFGAGYDAFRYRDAMVPLIMLSAAKGLETTLRAWSSAGMWATMLKLYGIGVVGLVLMRGLGILRL